MENTAAIIKKATSDNSEVAAELSIAALGSSVSELFGTTSKEKALGYLSQLWTRKRNRFSYEYSHMAMIEGKPVGLMTCFPGEMTDKTLMPTVWQLIKIGRLPFLKHLMSQLRLLRHFSSQVEAYPDEFYVGTLAVLSEYRGFSIGTQFLGFACELAQNLGFEKCSLIVDVDNEGGIRFYKRHGFVVAEHITKPVAFYRMVKRL